MKITKKGVYKGVFFMPLYTCFLIKNGKIQIFFFKCAENNENHKKRCIQRGVFYAVVYTFFEEIKKKILNVLRIMKITKKDVYKGVFFIPLYTYFFIFYFFLKIKISIM